MRKFNPFANLSLKIIALLFATLFWIYIVNIGDPIDERPFRDIPVTILNPEIITAQGMAFQVIGDTEEVTVMVRARVSLFREFTLRDIEVTADMTLIDLSTNLVPIEVSIRGLEGAIESATAFPGNVQIQIDPVAVNNFPVVVDVTGTPREGYVVGELEVNHPTFVIEGPETLIQSISRVVAQIDVSGMSMTADLPATVRVYNYEDNEISLSSLRIHELAEEELTVRVQMLSTRNIVLHYNIEEVIGEIQEGYQLSELSFEPSTVFVSGAPDVLMTLQEIIVPTNTLGIGASIGSDVTTIDIRPYLPEGIQLVDENAYRIVVSWVVEQIDRRGIEISARAIQIRHRAENLQIDFPSEQSVTFVFIGGREELDILDIGGQVYLDLLEFVNPGRYTLPVRIEALNVEGVRVFGALPMIEIELTLLEEAEETEE